MNWLSPTALALLIVANSAPVVIGWLAGPHAAWPLDFGIRLADGERLLGAHKTWRGLLAATIVAMPVATLAGLPAAIGAAFGVLAMTGDAFSSFLKRRLRLRSGHWVPLLDQLPEAVLPMSVLASELGLTMTSIAGTFLLFTALDLVASRTLGSSRKPPSPP